MAPAIGTVLTYNDITLDMIKTHTVFQEPIYSADNVDYLWTKIQIQVRAVFNTALNPTMIGEGSPTETMARVRSCLLTPRKVLLFTVCGKNLVLSPPNATTDASNGPKPDYCNVTRIDGADTFIIDYSVTTWLNECCSSIPGEPGPVNPRPYVSNRWTEGQTFDEGMYCHRHIEGILVVRADALTNPDSLRGIIFVPTPDGYERRNAKYTVTSDNLQYHYSWDDVEVYKVAPRPAATWTGQMLTTNENKSQVVIQEAIITMNGTKESSKANMIINAVIIALGRLFPVQPPNQVIIPTTTFAGGGNTPQVIVRASIREALHTNQIEVRVSAFSQPLGETLMGGFNAAGFKGDLEHVKGVDAPPLPFDDGRQFQSDNFSLGLNFLQKTLDDPCAQSETDVTNDVNPGAPLMANKTENAKVTPDQVQFVSALPNANNIINTSNVTTGIYTFYYMTQEYQTKNHVMQLPLMSSSSTQTTSFATVAQPTMIRIVKFDGERVGSPPTAPSPDLFDQNNVLLASSVTPQTPQTMADCATLLWRISGEYIYGVKEASQATMVTGTYPYLNVSGSQMTIPTSTFQQGLLDAPAQTGGSFIGFIEG